MLPDISTEFLGEGSIYPDIGATQSSTSCPGATIVGGSVASFFFSTTGYIVGIEPSSFLSNLKPLYLPQFISRQNPTGSI